MTRIDLALAPHEHRCQAGEARHQGTLPAAARLNDWLRIKATDGFRSAQIDYWMNGKPRSDPAPRWNLLDALMNRKSGT